MTRLSCLKLEWQRSSLRVVEYWRLSEDTPKRRAHITQYKQAAASSMLRMVQQASCLTHLDLLCVRIRASEIVAILKHLGPRLRHSGVAFHDQHEKSVGRFKIILEAVMEHNRELCTVFLKFEILPEFLHIANIEERFLTEQQVERLREGKKLLRVLVRRVRKFVPTLDPASLESWINTIEWVERQEV